MLKKQEPPKPEPYYKKYIREQKEEEIRLKKEAERRLKQEKLKESEQVIIVVDEVSEIQQLNFSAQSTLNQIVNQGEYPLVSVADFQKQNTNRVTTQP